MFDAFAGAIARASGHERFFAPLRPLVARTVLADPANARLVMRFGAEGDDDADLLAWGVPGQAPLLFSVRARVDGGNLAPVVQVFDPQPLLGPLLPAAVGARLSDLAGLLQSWVGGGA